MDFGPRSGSIMEAVCRRGNTAMPPGEGGGSPGEEGAEDQAGAQAGGGQAGAQACAKVSKESRFSKYSLNPNLQGVKTRRPAFPHASSCP